jgi:hypothetical protein
MCPSAWDVHRKRSQIAVVDDTGVPQRNRIVPNDPVQLVPIHPSRCNAWSAWQPR